MTRDRCENKTERTEGRTKEEVSDKDERLEGKKRK